MGKPHTDPDQYQAELSDAVDDGGGCAETWNALSDLRTSTVDQAGISRRSVLKMSSAATAASLIPGLSAAEISDGDDILDRTDVSRVMNEAGNPEVDHTEWRTVEIVEGEILNLFVAHTETGALQFFDPRRSEGEDFPELDPETTYYFDDLTKETRRKLPERFKRLPAEVDLALYYWGEEVYASRSATNRESSELNSVIEETDGELETDAVYNEDESAFFVPVGDDKALWLFLDEDHPAEDHQDIHAALREGAYEFEITDSEDRPTSISSHEWLGGSCWGGWATPCVQCVFGSGGCVACAGICSFTGGLGCIPCIVAVCAGTGVTCGCCLSCQSDYHNPICY